MDPARPRATAIALAGERIVAVGGAEVAALAGPGTRLHDCGGGTVLPGFVESHLHLGLGGAQLGHLQVGGLPDASALAQAFRAFAAAHPARPLLMAQGADYGLLGPGLPRAALDEILPDRPIAMTAADLHTVWANTAALAAAGLLHGAATPPGHEVVMGEDGLATGELREFEAFAPIIALGGESRLNLGIATGEEPASVTDEDRAQDRRAFAAGLAHAARHGITSMVMMDGNRYTLDLLAGLRAAGGLTARVKVPFHFKPHMELEALEQASAMARDFADDWLSAGFVKLFMDGVVDSRTAAMLQDYPDAPGHRGALLFAPARFAAIATEADRRGLQVAVHAIGDRAVRVTLDGYAAARAANGPRDARHRIEHIEVIDRADIHRLADLGVTASLQPVHAPGAMDFGLDGTLEVLGPERLPRAYLCRDLCEAGAPVCFASDWPVADISVLRGIRAALTRPAYPGGSDQRLGLMETLHAYTAGGARAAHMDHLSGSLREGMAADVVVLSGDIEATPPDAIDRLHVTITIAGGRITHEAVRRA
ncbi:MAG: amidohydrolase family protein [Limimaricola sp.]|uniref:amidohydrolase n=1 Tax=Limimaricola sp. TaxID=2211665 RepID=UPI001E1883D7|nr:amidohydrolase family protein [Limimaricola sp.]